MMMHFSWSTFTLFLASIRVWSMLLTSPLVAAPSAVEGVVGDALIAAPFDDQDRGHQAQDSRVEQLLIRGLTRLYLEDYEGAVSVFDEALKLRPNDSALLSSMVKAKMGLGDLSSASFFIQQAIDNDERNATLWELFAELSAATEDFSALLNARRQLALLRKKNTSSHLDLIRLLSRLEHFEDALKATTVAVEMVGADARILTERVAAFEKLGLVTEMDQTLAQLSELEPSNLSHRIELGGSYVRQSLWEKAESVFRSILAVEPDNLEAGESLAAVLHHMGRTDEGQAILAEIRSMNQRIAASPGILVDLLTPDGLTAASDDQLRKWLSEHPTHKEALQELAERLITDGDALQAADLYSRIVARYPQELEMWLAAIDAYLSGRDNQLALETANQGLLLFPGYAPLRIGRAEALVAVGQTESALNAIKELLILVTDPRQKVVLNALLDQIEAM